MRSYEFDKKCNEKIYLGETTSCMCFIKRDSEYEPAVLCIEPSFSEGALTIKAVSGILCWDRHTKEVKRISFDYGKQKELGLPMAISDEPAGGEFTDDELKAYYVLIEKICVALEAGCVTSGMKEKYNDILTKYGFGKGSEMHRIMCDIFPDAMNILK